jgi:hypothetical protein
MRECKECDRPVFGGGYCKYHQFRRRMQNGDKFKRKAPVKKRLPQESKKRKVEHKRYTEQVLEHRTKCKEDGTYICFFCLEGEDLSTKDKWLCNHHWEERGANYLNVDTWSWTHNSCHNIWHFASMEELKEQEWYNEEFLTRLKAKSIVAYSKQIRKEEKSEELFGDVEN